MLTARLYIRRRHKRLMPEVRQSRLASSRVHFLLGVFRIWLQMPEINMFPFQT
jgi:hypothetical protein